MIEVLRTTDIDDKDLHLIINLYWYQKASISVEGNCSEVRQGCILYPTLFNLYSEQTFSMVQVSTDAGVLVNEEGRYHCVRRFSRRSYSYWWILWLTLVLSTDYPSMPRKRGAWLLVNILGQLVINNKQIEKVTNYTYLGTTIFEQWDHSAETKCRIEKAKMGNIFKSRGLNLHTKL